MELDALLDELPLELTFELDREQHNQLYLPLAKAVTRHLLYLPISVLFWEPFGDEAGTITINWDAVFQYRIVSGVATGGGTYLYRVVFARLV